MHSDDELAELVGAEILERKTIHEWPLSCVQKITLSGGTKLAYKSQLPPTVEAQFYERTTSSLLPRHRLLGRLGNCDTMAIEWIDAPLLSDVIRSSDDLVDHGRRLLSQIGEMRGECPVHLRIDSHESWSRVVSNALEKLRELIAGRRFRSIGLDAVDALRKWAESGEVSGAIDGRSGVIHGDLKPDQVFVLADEYRVIDWQRPIAAPAEIDLVSLCVGHGIEPGPYVDRTFIQLFWFLRLNWAVEAQFDLFPNFKGPLFEQWSAEAVSHLLA